MKFRFNIAFFILAALCIFANEVKAADSIITRYASEKIYSQLSITDSDIKHYKRAFRAIEKEDFATADEELSEVENNILLGHALAQKYLSKTYKTSYQELADWLKLYSDHPQKGRIARLAQRKNPNKKMQTEIVHRHPAMPNTDLAKMKKADRNFVLKQYSLFRRSVNRGQTKKARLVLENQRFKRLVKNRDLDSLASVLAMKYLTDNYDKLAFQWASKASNRSHDVTASWIAGLSAWKMKQYKTAEKYFDRVLQDSKQDEWMASAGGYWAYRAAKKLKQTQKATQFLNQARKYKRTFYGILASYKLGIKPEYNWTLFSYLNDFSQDDYIMEIISSASLQRAILLLHVKQPELAEKELRNAKDNMTEKQKELALFIAKQYQMHALAISLSKQLQDDDNNMAYDVLAYPVPDWQPKDGWKVDKALILALMRQESSFSPKAKSPAGAYGLMQLLPSTAAHVTKNRALRRNNSPLLEAEYNISVGQKYVHYLLEKDYINGNLFYMMVAYNAGPGNLLKWKKQIKDNDDPLLFIEIIPAKETRLYIERVMANYWIYQSRFERSLTGIEALSAGKWPMLEENQ